MKKYGEVYLELIGLWVSVELCCCLSRWPCRFGGDKSIQECQWGKIAENRERFLAAAKRNSLFLREDMPYVVCVRLK